MRASHKWLEELSGVEAPAEEVAERLTAVGLEVETIERFGEELDAVVIAEVRTSRPVPDRDKLTAVTVFDGDQELQVICGAPNVPPPSGRVLLARVGTRLPGGLTIGERTIAGVRSRGMLVSEQELGVGDDASGIIVLSSDERGVPGESAVSALGLRDAVFEVGLTPNRPDGLGHVGLAREVALCFGVPFRAPVPAAPRRVAAATGLVDASGRFDLRSHWSGSSMELVLSPEVALATAGSAVAVEILDAERCPRYGAALVFGVHIAPSPRWLRHRLHCLGVRAIHNVVDVTNYVMLEWSHPIHAFDLAVVRGRRVVVRTAREGERMTTLDGVERKMTSDDLLICDGEGPVAIAGVMGGENSEIRDTTRNVLIECAYFDPRSVRRTSRRVGLHTDASHRFERGVDPGAVPVVLARTAQLVADLCSGTVFEDALDVCPRPPVPRRVRYRGSRATAVLGFETPTDAACRILEGLGCTVTRDDADLEATVPTWRPDLAREEDLFEEVARIRGYHHIPTVVPAVKPSAHGSPRAVTFQRKLREAAAAAGLTEAVTYSFLAPRDLEAARVSTDAVPLQNPLSEDRSVMRTSLLPGLAAAARRSLNRQVESVALFEVGRTFHPADAVLPEEQARLAFLLCGPRPNWIGSGPPAGFYDGKGILEAIVRPVAGVTPTVHATETVSGTAPYLHPRRCAAVRLADHPIGVLGELHPDVGGGLGLGEAVFCELSIAALLGAADRIGTPQARPLPRFPHVARDIAMIVPDGLASEEIASALREGAPDLIEEVRLFDLYRGEQVPAGHRSLAYRIIYRDPAATLTDLRVDEAHAAVLGVARERFGASIR